MPEPWQEFEELAYRIQRDFAGSEATVKLRDTIRGVDSGTERQIDISIRQRAGPHEILIVVDCKAHQQPIDINTVEQFVTAVRDVRANKGALIASRGFSSAAVRLARTHGIDTFTLVDTTSTSWRAYVSIPTLLQRAYVASAAFRVEGSASPGTILPADPRLLRLQSPDGTSTMTDLLARKWNRQEIPTTAGRHTVVLAVNAAVEDVPTALTASVQVDVAEAFYFGHLPIQTRGFHDAQTGGLIIRDFETDLLSPFEIEQGRVEGWRQIGDPAELAVRPALRLGYLDPLPVSTERESTGSPDVD